MAGDLQVVVIRNHHLKQFLGREIKEELTRYVTISSGGPAGEIPRRLMGGGLYTPRLLPQVTERVETCRVFLMGFIISGP